MKKRKKESLRILGLIHHLELEKILLYRIKL